MDVKFICSRCKQILKEKIIFRIKNLYFKDINTAITFKAKERLCSN